MARPRTKVTANQTRSIVSRYKKGTGLVALAEMFGFSAPVIRRVLADGAVEIRGRGRPVLA